MRLNRNVAGAGVLTGASVFLLAGSVMAQAAPPPAPPPPAAPPAAAPQPAKPPQAAKPAQPAPAQPAPAQPAPAQPPVNQAQAAEEPAPAPAPAEPPPVEEPPPEPPPAMEAEAGVGATMGADATMGTDPAAVPPMEPPAADPPAEEEAEDSPVSFMLFADAYAGYQTAAIGSPAPWHRAYEFNAAGTMNKGFGLAFLGLDASYDIGEAAATGSLRFGPGVPVFYAADTGPLGIDNIIQAYATWRPVEGLDLDLGQFGTIFGAEVLESWMNLNYTRGGLYYGMQPFWHTGFRGAYAFSDQFSMKLMLVNGVNNVFMNPGGSPSAALQFGITPNDMFSLAIGGLFNFDGENDGTTFDRFFDLVATLSVDDFTLIFNGDYNINVADESVGGDDTSFYGLSLAAGYAFTDMFGVALRGEYLADADNTLYAAAGAEDVNVITGTLTLDFKPIQDKQNLVIRWDNRIETGSEDIFFNNDNEATGSWFESVVGVVVHTGG